MKGLPPLLLMEDTARGSASGICAVIAQLQQASCSPNPDDCLAALSQSPPECGRQSERTLLAGWTRERLREKFSIHLSLAPLTK